MIAALPHAGVLIMPVTTPDRRNFLLTAAGLAFTGQARAQQGPGPREVDLALVLAADCSGSMKPEHYVLQQRGYGAAFRDPAIIKAIRSGLSGAIAVCYFQWSGFPIQNLILPWTVLDSTVSIARYAALLEETERSIYGGGTSPAGAIRFGQRQIERLEIAATRKVIDVSGDGRANNGPPPDDMRDIAVAAGITVNGLPIMHLEIDIDEYYARHVIGGPGAFMVPARDFASFQEAIRKKLVLEIAGGAQAEERQT